MIKKRKYRRLPLYEALIFFAIVIALILSPYLFLHTSYGQQIIKDQVSKHTDYQIGWSDLIWKVWKNSITIDDPFFIQLKNDSSLSAKKLNLKYSLLGLIRGKVVISKLEVDALDVDISRSKPGEKKAKKELNLTKLVLLQNLEIEDLSLKDFIIHLKNNNKLNIGAANIALSTSIFRETSLSVVLGNLSFGDSFEESVSSSSIKLDILTDINNFKNTFPFTTKGGGHLSVTGLLLKKLPVDALEANLKVQGNSIALTQSSIKIGGHDAKLNLNVDTLSEEYSVKINMPSPIKLPHFGKDIDTIHTAGKLSGNIDINGKGLNFSKAIATLNLTHSFDVDPEKPANIVAKVHINNGVLSIIEANLNVDNYIISSDGTIDTNSKNVLIKFQSDNFPLELAFNKFKNKHLQPINGPTKFDGSYTGWGKDFAVKLNGATQGGGYYEIVGEKIVAYFEATYKHIILKGDIYQNDKKTGVADLKINFGERPSRNADRYKEIDFHATLTNHTLDNSLKTYRATGLGNGEIRINGPVTNFKGEATIDVEQGSVWGHYLKKLTTTFTLSPQKLIFNNYQISYEDFEPVYSRHPIEMGIETDAGFSVKGRLHDKTLIDLFYFTQNKKLQINKIIYSDREVKEAKMTASGDVVFEQSINLTLDGKVDIGFLKTFEENIREAQGFVDGKIIISGPISDPNITGALYLDKVAFFPRNIRYKPYDLSGTIVFNGKQIKTKHFAGSYEDGRFSLFGNIEHQSLQLKNFNLSIEGTKLPFANEDRDFKAEMDCQLNWAGSQNGSKLKGYISILEGKYTKNYELLEQLTKSKKHELRKKRQAQESTYKNVVLDLKVDSTGDFFIRNNLGDIELKANLDVIGAAETPIINGSIEAIFGEIHYLGINFDIVQGFLDFNENEPDNPYIEVIGEEEISSYTVTAKLYGKLDKLMMELSAMGGEAGTLDRQDTLSLITLGMTQREAQQYSSNLNTRMASGVVAEQVSRVVERPITKFTHLDVFRLEAGNGSSA
ncbi:translocation/assembly module TamB domain-containing protein [bacterium]|nr:translocation/assembly module TamB domain-containing protein [bacterium]